MINYLAQSVITFKKPFKYNLHMSIRSIWNEKEKKNVLRGSEFRRKKKRKGRGKSKRSSNSRKSSKPRRRRRRNESLRRKRRLN